MLLSLLPGPEQGLIPPRSVLTFHIARQAGGSPSIPRNRLPVLSPMSHDPLTAFASASRKGVE
jgi:hypothetical protein